MARKTDPSYFYVENSSPRKLWVVLLDAFLIIVTISLAAALVMAYLAQSISPERVWYLAFFGLIAPFLFLGNFLMLLIWAIRWRFWAIIPLLTLLAGVGSIGQHLQIRLARDYHAEVKSPDHLRILTYNLHGFFYKTDNNHEGYISNMDSIASYINRENPDLICFQEYEVMSNADRAIIDSLLAPWPHRAINFILGGSDQIGYGTAIFSRYPIIKSEGFQFEGSDNSALMAEIAFNQDTIMVVDAHLQSTQINPTNKNKVENLDIMSRDEANNNTLIRAVGSSLKQNYIRRAAQVDSLSHIISESPYPVIVAGDFNDTPVSYTYRHMRGDLLDSFVERGNGFGYTYNRLFSILRIDYILHSPSFETVSYKSDALPWSDHNPVVATIRKSAQ